MEPPAQSYRVGEHKILFAAPLWYEILVGFCVVGGLVLAYWAWQHPASFPMIGLASVWAWIWLLVVGAGVWAALSVDRLILDLKDRTYERWVGGGFWMKRSRGSLTYIDAVVMSAEHIQHFGTVERMVVRLTMYWIGHREPVMVLARKDMVVREDLSQMGKRGYELAQAIGVKFVDNSAHFSKKPFSPL